MELIDRNALLAEIEKIWRKAYNDCEDSYFFDGLLATRLVVKNATTVESVPVVHARWIDSPNIPECVVCSNCMSDSLSAQVIAPAPDWYRYCLCCGAKMDGKEQT